ncbi:MAG: hypothetical protein K6356_07575 [Chloroflexus sp.]
MELSFFVLALFIIVGLIVIAVVVWSIVWFLIKIGVIVQKVVEPPTRDYGSYSIEQGRDVGENQR